MIRTAVLTISDSCFRGERADASGPAVATRLASAGFDVRHTAVLPDERGEISAALRQLSAEGGYEAIFTTGGTGITARDVTPEATRDVLDRELPGFGELMRAYGLGFTRRAALSRGLAGTRNTCLIVNLPGSPKGAAQSLDAILDLVPHVVDVLRGKTAHAEDLKRS
jgi:molybdenum cofactor synthesis domain-containing protein